MPETEPSLSLRTRLLLAAAVVGAATLIAWIGYARAGPPSAQQPSLLDLWNRQLAAEQRAHREALRDEAVHSTLQGLRLELCLGPTRDEAVSLELIVHKAFGQEWIVESPLHTAVFLVDGGEAIRFDSEPPPEAGALTRLAANIDSYTYRLDVDRARVAGRSVTAEWVARDPRSGESERLRSEPLVVPEERH